MIRSLDPSSFQLFRRRFSSRTSAPPAFSRPEDFKAIVGHVRTVVAGLKNVADSELQHRFEDLRGHKAAHGDSTNDQITTMALTTEAVCRTTGKTYYDVQLQAGHVLSSGLLAEMATGEGKTLVTLLPVVHAISSGQTVHVSTTNAYLANRDCSEGRAALELLGIQVGLLPEDNDTSAKTKAYLADVTYGTGYEFGFDYLRDQMTLRQFEQQPLGMSWLQQLSGSTASDPVLTQPHRQVSIVDEIDSVLIDEANTPLVISFFSSDSPNADAYQLADHVATSLRQHDDFQMDTAGQRIVLLLNGVHKIRASYARAQNVTLHRPWQVYVEQALKARYFFRRNVDYVVNADGVALVDQSTGRVFPDRKLRDGLHQAIECREKVKLTPETDSFARISRQRFFKRYQSATGMTGTATDAAAEFESFFGLSVCRIPLNRPCRRQRYSTRFFADREAKDHAIVADAGRRHATGQPVLIGTRTIEQSLQISELLSAQRLPHLVLNGIQDAEEADVISLAGQAESITVATNMAGRGTDIRLAETARAVGGLHVIASEPNRSQRVDRQLVGRCARQGDPGSCQMFVSADDDLLQRVGFRLAEQLRTQADRSGEARGQFDQSLAAIQTQAERDDFMRRQQLLQQDLWSEGLLDTFVRRA